MVCKEETCGVSLHSLQSSDRKLAGWLDTICVCVRLRCSQVCVSREPNKPQTTNHNTRKAAGCWLVADGF